jgi:D-arabinose 1-dehydrogenase-like Zn-dependent alcohol dehydrogenase
LTNATLAWNFQVLAVPEIGNSAAKAADFVILSMQHPGDLIMRRIRILGSQQNDREYLHEALQIAASGKVKVMTETYPLDEITKAYERVADGKVRFRAVITTSN